MIASKALLFTALACAAVFAQSAALQSEANSVYPEAHALYLDLHQHPELSSHETRTATVIAEKLRALGYNVTEHVGGTGIVAILKNGDGPTVMLRTELDALPVTEQTGLPYASTVHSKDDQGHDVGVMHACGHDVHMSSLYGTAEIMARHKDQWHGTLMLIGQPAEETISGAKAMLDDGLLKRFPRPDVGVALHVFNGEPAGKVGISSGPAYSAADSLRVTIYGRGGHGSAPHTTIDPVLIAAKTVIGLQSIVSREVKPGQFAVITVGYLQAGTKNNIIPDTAQMGITVRTYDPKVREQVLKAIDRVIKGEAESAGAVKMPLVERYESTPVTYNDPALAAREKAVLAQALGKDNVLDREPETGSEDYAYFVQAGIPSFYFRLGGAEPAKFEEAKKNGTNLPSNHSSLFAPDANPAIHTGIEAEVAVLEDLFNKKGPYGSTEQKAGE